VVEGGLLDLVTDPGISPDQGVAILNGCFNVRPGIAPSNGAYELDYHKLRGSNGHFEAFPWPHGRLLGHDIADIGLLIKGSIITVYMRSGNIPSQLTTAVRVQSLM
jgi:hypothetical protein